MFGISEENLPALLVLFAAAGRDGADKLEAGGFLCTKQREYKGKNGKSPVQQLLPCISPREAEQLGQLLIGQHRAHLQKQTVCLQQFH